jgi:hypothetical protein
MECKGGQSRRYNQNNGFNCSKYSQVIVGKVTHETAMAFAIMKARLDDWSAFKTTLCSTLDIVASKVETEWSRIKGDAEISKPEALKA